MKGTSSQTCDSFECVCVFDIAKEATQKIYKVLFSLNLYVVGIKHPDQEIKLDVNCRIKLTKAERRQQKDLS